MNRTCRKDVDGLNHLALVLQLCVSHYKIDGNEEKNKVIAEVYARSSKAMDKLKDDAGRNTFAFLVEESPYRRLIANHYKENETDRGNLVVAITKQQAQEKWQMAL